MKTITHSDNSNRDQENYGGEFSILNSHQYTENASNKSEDKSIAYTSFLYILSILSIACWIISLKILPFGDMFQFLLGAVVLTVNMMVFKWTKL
ncbi:MAG: hypothetical protein KKG25_04330 [Bacteroidetes bacterium]|nr:hypothetical protein [Bacteroidota bacterium]MBU1484072.1 hypothetical protein [Bacteroidota bacterium]MBU2268444.1 hypothetical protein [Bacteroidota bacterium]MBU2376245.1 hypothetical protein [Bacteroidota bacterium]